MTKPVTIPNTFATATTAIPLSNLDADFSAVATALNDANTYSNYAPDTGSANAYVVTLSGVSTTYSAGLRIQFKAGNANTTASTLNVNGGGAKNITYQDATAIASGTIAANSIVDVMYDGTQFLLMNDPAGATGGDVVGPSSATDNAIVRFDGTTGKLVQNSVVTIADSTGDISGVGQLNATTVDATNIEVTNIKAKDGTAAASIADSTGVVSITANPILSGGTANGVGYLNGSKVLTTGTALTFDGTNLVNLGGVVRALAAATQDALQLQGRAGGTSSYITTLTPGTLTASNTLTLPVGTTTLAGLGTTQTFSAAQTFSSTVTMSGTTTNIDLGTSQTSGTWTAGGAAQTGTITLDRSTKTHTLAIGTGATESGLTKTINIGTGGVATSTTAITIGSTNDTTITLNGTVNATTVNLTTLDLTNLEVTNIKAKDGTAAITIADSTGVVSFTANPVMSGGTANGVLYLNGSKVATSGSALTFDGTNFATTGTATATKLIPTGNVLTGNGLHLPAANSVAITTNGANAIYIDSSQNVGIGTSSPGAKLEVSGGDSLLRGGKFIIGPTAGGNGAGAIRGTLNGVLGSLIFQTENSSAVLTDVMTLDSSGNLGLGVTPSAWGSGKGFEVGYNGNAVWSYSQTDSYLTHNAKFTDAWRYASSNAASSYRQSAGVHIWQTAPSGTAGNAITFTQAMTLDASGNLLVGHTAVYSPVSNYKSVQINGVTGGIVDMGDGSGVYGRTSADVNGLNLEALGSRYTAFRTNGSERARITSGGEVYIAGTTDQGAYNLQVNGTGVWGAGAYVNGSDERLKDNIQTLNDGLAVVSQLRPVTFQYKPEHSKDQSVQPGFIAQELQQTMAGKDYVDGVVKSGPEYLNVAYQNLIPILTKAIQEQQALITSLTARVALLEGN